MRLNSSIFPPGTCVIVTPLIKNRSVPPFSRGFVQTYRTAARQFPNVSLVDLSIIRVGKKGKPRLSMLTVAACVFDMEIEKKNTEWTELKGFPLVHIIKNKCPLCVSELSDPEFIGWAHAYTRHLRNLYENVKNKWPRKINHPINKMLNMPMVNPDLMGAYCKSFAHQNLRDEFLYDARKLESSVPRIALSVCLERERIELKATAYLIYTNLLAKEKFYDTALLNKEYTIRRGKIIGVANEIYKMDKSRYDTVVKRSKNEKIAIAKPNKYKALPGIVRVRNVLTGAIRSGRNLDFNYMFNTTLY